MNEMTNSHILVHEFSYQEPTTLAKAVELLRQYGSEGRILAGGTDLLVQMKMERVKPAIVIGIGRIPELGRVELRDDGLHIGAMVTIRTLRQHPLVRRDYPALAQACAAFSTTQIQTMGTIGGNLCNASPASDSAPALIAYDAQAVVLGPDGERRLRVEDLFLAPGKNALEPGEMLVEVVLPRSNARPADAFEGSGGAFLKLARVAADIAKINAAIHMVRLGERIVNCRVVFGSVAPRPVRALLAEALLAGQPYDAELVRRAAAAAAAEVAPIDDVRSTADYRRQMASVMVRDGLERAWAAACGDETARGNGHEASVEYARGAESPPGAGQDGWDSAPAQRNRLEAIDRREITLTVNGAQRRVWVAPNDLLLNVLREDLQLTGTKYGCGIGECSACTIEMDGKPALACLVLAVTAAGREVVTVEGLRRPNGDLDPLQEAFLDHGAYQCGFCTPGMLMTARSLLRENPAPDEADVRDHLKGNLCRCTGYASIVRAVMNAGEAASPGLRSGQAPLPAPRPGREEA